VSEKTSRAPSLSFLLPVEVQIFGLKKNADTRKALRFFAERRVKTHFVDLAERAASLGELNRFAQKFGIQALIDRNSKRYHELGYAHAQYSDVRWMEKLIDEPMLLRIPLTRFANRLTIGLAEPEWTSWMQG
jgi:arsenate reductase-like glutaredoxin family protein